MPKPTENYIAAMSVRYVLIKLGEKLGYKEFKKESKCGGKEWENIKKYFEMRCCYCEEKTEKLEMDHIVGFNQMELGFDCLGNVAPVCRKCNGKKPAEGKDQRFAWEIHLEKICTGNTISFQKRKEKISIYMKKHNYPPPNYEDILKRYREKIQNFYDVIQKQLKKQTEDLLCSQKNSDSRTISSCKHNTIKSLMKELLSKTPDILYEEAEKIVLTEFPNSAFDKKHFSWYKTKILK